MRAASSSGGGTARRNDRLAEEGARLSLLVLVEIDVGRDYGRKQTEKTHQLFSFPFFITENEGGSGNGI